MFSNPTMHIVVILVHLWLHKYFYWIPQNDCLVRRNFEIQGAKQLKSMFAYARKTGKMPKFLSPDNAEQLRKYWESPDFKKVSEQNKKNRNSDQGAWDHPFTHVVLVPSRSGEDDT